MQYRELTDLKKLEGNPRTIGDKEFQALCTSIRNNPEYFEARPLILSNRTGELVIIAGNQRYDAAKTMGLQKVPTFLLEGLTEAKEREIVIRDNVSNGQWDMELLEANWSDLPLLDFGVALPEDWLSSKSDIDPDDFSADDAAAEIKDPVTRPGDVWLLGRHRLMCGDSTNADNVKRLWGGARPLLMVTDPPYGVEYDASWRDVLKDGAHDLAKGKVLNDNRADWREAWALFSGDVAYVWHAGSKAQVVADSLTASGFQIRSQIVWAKNQLVISRGHYHSQHEPCWYAVRKGKTAHWKGGRKKTTLWKSLPEVVRSGEEVYVRRIDADLLWALSGDESTVWEIDKPLKSETGHSTQKPVECMARAIRNHDSKGVYDPFLGSGTTLIAAEQLGRTCYGMELSPIYCDVICRRFEEFTGEKPILEAIS